MITNISALAIIASINPVAMPISSQANDLPANIVTINKHDIIAEINVIQRENKKLAELNVNFVDTKRDIDQIKNIDIATTNSDESIERVQIIPVKTEQSDEE